MKPLSTDRDDDRRRNALPTRDDVIVPTLGSYHGQQREGAERMAAFYIERAESVRRAQGNPPLTDEEKIAIRKEHGAA